MKPWLHTSQGPPFPKGTTLRVVTPLCTEPEQEKGHKKVVPSLALGCLPTFILYPGLNYSSCFVT